MSLPVEWEDVHMGSLPQDRESSWETLRTACLYEGVDAGVGEEMTQL